MSCQDTIEMALNINVFLSALLALFTFDAISFLIEQIGGFISAYRDSENIGDK